MTKPSEVPLPQHRSLTRSLAAPSLAALLFLALTPAPASAAVEQYKGITTREVLRNSVLKTVMYAYINVDYTNHVNRAYATAYEYYNGSYDPGCFDANTSQATSFKNGAALVNGPTNGYACATESYTNTIACGGGHLWSSRATMNNSFNTYTLNSNGQATAC